MIWNIVYALYPPILRFLERIGIHRKRQPFLIGRLDGDLDELRAHLEQNGFEDAILAWRDPGETLSMRNVHDDVYQYHVRVFDDGEVRCHDEYSSEGNPSGHVREHYFESEKEFFLRILGRFVRRK